MAAALEMMEMKVVAAFAKRQRPQITVSMFNAVVPKNRGVIKRLHGPPEYMGHGAAAL